MRTIATRPCLISACLKKASVSSPPSVAKPTGSNTLLPVSGPTPSLFDEEMQSAAEKGAAWRSRWHSRSHGLNAHARGEAAADDATHRRDRRGEGKGRLWQRQHLSATELFQGSVCDLRATNCSPGAGHFFFVGHSGMRG